MNFGTYGGGRMSVASPLHVAEIEPKRRNPRLNCCFVRGQKSIRLT
jgi:hypothetical protein